MYIVLIQLLDIISYLSRKYCSNMHLICGHIRLIYRDVALVYAARVGLAACFTILTSLKRHIIHRSKQRILRYSH
jgi:hypothetical protein